MWESLLAITFTDEEMKMIQQYKELSESVSLEVAVMNAISIALDRKDFE